MQDQQNVNDTMTVCKGSFGPFQHMSEVFKNGRLTVRLAPFQVLRNAMEVPDMVSAQTKGEKETSACLWAEQTPRLRFKKSLQFRIVL